MRLTLTALLMCAALPAHAEIVPLDGTWTSRALAGEIGEACDQAVRPMIEPMFAAMMNAEQATEVAWGGTFDPSSMTEAQQEGVTWERTGESAWTGSISLEDGAPPAMTFTMEAVSKTRIEGTVTMDVRMMAGPDMTDMAGNPIDATGCVIAVRTEMTHGG